MLSSLPPPNATKDVAAQHQVFDIIMVVAMKEILIARTTKDDLDSNRVITKIAHCLRTIVRCYPTKSIKTAIKSLQLANLLTCDNQPNLDHTNQT